MWRRDLEDLIKTGEQRARRLRDTAGEEALSWLRDHLPSLRPAPPPPPEPPPLARAAWVIPALAAAAGTGAALWWWTQWARGRAEAQSRAEFDAAGGAEGQAHPEQVMAHNPEPPEAPMEVADPADSDLSVPAEDVMAHSPPPAESEGSDEAAPKRRTPAKTTRATTDEAKLLASASPVGLGDATPHLTMGEGPSTLDQALAAKSKSGGGTRGGGFG